MLSKLVEARKRHGDSWLIVPISQLRRRLKKEFQEWCNAKDKETELKELIDIANQCLLLYFRLLEKR